MAVRIPTAFAREAGFRDGAEVDLRMEAGKLVLEPLMGAPTLEELLAGVTVENTHRVAEWGPPGQERFQS